jgi:hypothetical protein
MIPSALSKLLEKFSHEARIIEVSNVTFPLPWGYKVYQGYIRIPFRGMVAEGKITATKSEEGSLLGLLVSLRGNPNVIACSIACYSHLIGMKPKIIYYDVHEPTGTADITAEWYREGVIDIRQRLADHKLLGYKIKKTIKFEDVLEEARKFLEETYKQ